MGGRKITLYVKSTRDLIGTQEFEHRLVDRQLGARPSRVELEGKRAAGTFQAKTYQSEIQPKYEFVLPKEQEEVAKIVQELCIQYDLELTIVDATKKPILHREIDEHIRGIRKFPTLLGSSGRRIEGKISKDQVAAFLFKERQTWMGSVPA